MNLDMGLGIELGKLVPALGWVLLYFVWQGVIVGAVLSLIHISEPTDQRGSRMPSSA